MTTMLGCDGGAGAPVAGAPAAGAPAADTPATGAPAADAPATGGPAADTPAADTPAAAQEASRATGRMLRRIGRLAAMAPVTATLIALLWVVGAATGSLLTGPDTAVLAKMGVGVQALAAGRWWTPVTAALLSSGWAEYLAVTALLVAAATPMERRLGSLRAAVLLTGSQVIGSLAAVGTVEIASRAGDLWAEQLSGLAVVGCTPGIAGLLLAGSAMIDPLRRRRLRVMVLAVLITMTLYAGGLAEVIRLAAGLVGLAAGAIWSGPGRRVAGAVSAAAALDPAATGTAPDPRAAPSRRPGTANRRPGAAPSPASPVIGGDRRAVAAILVAAAALGPLSTLITAHRFGPLSALNFLFLPSVDGDQVASWCAGTAAAAHCSARATAFLIQGVGPLFQTLLPALVLLVLAEGLRRGRRSAYLGAVVANLALAVIGAAQSRREIADLIADSPQQVIAFSELWVVRLAPVALPIAIVLVLISSRRQFPVRLPWRLHRAWLGAVLGAVLGLTAVYLAVGWLVRDQFRPVPSFGRLLVSLPARLAPAGYLGAGHARFFPVGPVAVALYQWTGAAIWAVVLLATVQHFRRCRGADLSPARAAAAAMLRGSGGRSSLAYMTLWRGNDYLLTADGSSYIAYRVVSGVAVTTGDPVGPHPEAAIESFLARCAAAGWTPCFFSVTRQTADLLTRYRFHDLAVASDSVINPREVSFTGRRWQDIRTAISRAGREGATASWCRYPELAADLQRQIITIDHAWVAGKGLPEMGFTLGGIREIDDPEVRCLLALDASGQVIAVTSWLPGYRDGRVVGWTLDFMRRGPGAFPGVMEFLIATALTSLRDEGAEWVSLSGVPLAWPAGDRPAGVIGAGMDRLAGIMEPVYGFRSLLAFKRKFAPQFIPLYLCYPGSAALPAVSNAVLRAYVPHLGAAQTVDLARRLTRRS